MSYTLFRDDDISYTSDIHLVMKAHDIITKNGHIHTVAVQMYRLWECKEIWFWLMTAKNLAIGLHCWEHDDYSAMSAQKASEHIKRSLEYWKDKRHPSYNPPKIKTFFPPWNKTSDQLMQACTLNGLRLDSRVGGEVYGFHYWELIYPERVKRLEDACRNES